MKQEMSLDRLPCGRRAVVIDLSNEGAMRRRLRDIGMIEGALVECVGRSPGGDPAAYLLCGALIALRDCDSADILVCPLEE